MAIIEVIYGHKLIIILKIIYFFPYSEGETTYDLRDAQILRIKIAKIGENIDNISKRILAIGTTDIDNPPQGQVLRLHQMIRRSAEIFCKDNISTTPSLPSENDYILLQQNREKKIEQRIAYERQLEIEEAIKERKRDQKIDNNKNINTAGQSVKNNEVKLLIFNYIYNCF